MGDEVKSSPPPNKITIHDRLLGGYCEKDGCGLLSAASMFSLRKSTYWEETKKSYVLKFIQQNRIRDNGEEDPISIALPRLLFLPNIIFTHVANKKAPRATAAVSRTEASPAKPYDCKVTIRSRPSTIPFIKQRPKLSKSIDSNLVFDIVGHTLLFRRSKFSLVTGFACGKLVFPEYMDDSIPPFLRRVFTDKAKNLENKASLGKAAQGKAAKGKATKRNAAQGKAAQPSDIGDTHSVTILDLRSLIWDNEKWKILSVEDSIRVCLLYMSEQIFMGQEDKKVVNNSFLRLVEDLAVFGYWNRSPTVITGGLKNQKSYQGVLHGLGEKNGFTRDDEPEAEQDGSGALDRASAGAKVEEIKSTREVALEEELDLWKSRYVKLESYYKNLEASVEIARNNSPGLSFPTPNAKAMSVCDDIDEVMPQQMIMQWFATSVHDDVGVPDAAADDNAKATSVCDDINEADAAVDDNAKATSVHDDVGVPDGAADDNAKATSVCDDIDEADAASDDNAKATSVHDDVGVPDAASDDNAKATSVCDDINEVDAAAYDNAKATSVHDNVGVPDAAANDNAKVPISDVYNTPVDNENVLMKDAHEIINHTDPPIHGFQIMLWGGLEKKGDGLDEAKANHYELDTEPEVTVVKKPKKKRMSKRQRELPTSTIRRSKRHIQEVASAADNGEVVKKNQLPDSHEDVFQPHASKRMKKETLLSDCPPVIGNYFKEFHIGRWEDNLTRDSNTPKTRIHILKEVLDYLNQAKKPRHWFPWGNGLNIDEKFWHSLVARDATSRGFLTLLVVELWVQLMWHFRAKHADWAIPSPYYCNPPTLNDLGDWIFKDITYPVGHGVPEPVLKHVVPFVCELWVPTTKYANKDTKDMSHPEKASREGDKDTRGNTRDGKASREGENHTRESASILHEFYKDIRKFGL
ncbi:hypothetical protein Tco_1122660 [Tanacetum coccineum]|uniref:Aminotransferase-like plant mobile domain-containing protein n=1 Tax=Tanacetum coccineum TaxID=301880 RepID=A0ABQ5J2U6_9ASTR